MYFLINDSSQKNIFINVFKSPYKADETMRL